MLCCRNWRYGLAIVAFAAIDGGMATEAVGQARDGTARPVVIEAVDSVFAGCSARAMKAFGAARSRFGKGLPVRTEFFVTIRLQASSGGAEQVFVKVEQMPRDSVIGRIASNPERDIGVVFGNRVRMHESEVVDWTIRHPDGSEEGNWLGKAADRLAAGKRPECRSAAGRRA